MKRDKKPATQCMLAFPSLREHLLHRRDMLTWMGATLASGALWVGCPISGDVGASGLGYHTARLPTQGEDQTVLSGGGCRYFVIVTAACDNDYYEFIDDEERALATCREVLAQQDFAELAAVRNGGDPQPHYDAERQMTAAFSSVVSWHCYDPWVALTITEFLP